MLSIACVRKMQRYRVSNDMIKLNKLKEWVDNHWSRLNSTGSTPPPLLISLPIIVIVLSVELTLKLVNALMYYGTLQFITDKIEKRFVPSGGIKKDSFYVKAVLYFTSVINSNAIFNEVKIKVIE